MKNVVVVGAGPAGMRAAQVLAEAGLRPVLIDEAARVGGQVYRQAPAALQRPLSAMYGMQAPQAKNFFATWATLESRVDYRPQTLVWQLESGALHLLEKGCARVQPFDALVLATGATDRVLPFPGWTLPGVFTLGGAQVLLKSQAAAIGPRVVFAGSGPLLYLVASQYLKAGVQVLAVLDTAPTDAPTRALPGLLARPRLAAAGLAMMLRLRMAGVKVERGVTLVHAEGESFVQALQWSRGGRTFTTACDAIAFGHGLRSETQLADLAGCEFEFDAIEEAWLPRRDGEGRTSVPGVYIAGDGAAIRGADAAELAGARAAHALLRDLGVARDHAHAHAHAHAHGLAPAPLTAPDPHAMRRHDRWREAIAILAEPPRDWAAQAPDELIVCRCEHVTAGELRACVNETGAYEANRLKALSRIGMGRCQGRMCGTAAARLLAEASGCDLREVGRLRSQPPVKPVPVAALAAAVTQAPPVPVEEVDD